MTPSRIRLSRKRGFRMPGNALKVDRTTRWGNPYDVREYGHDLALRLFEHTARGRWVIAGVDVDEPTAFLLHEAHGRWLRRLGGDPVTRARAELRGRHLACWCGADDDCHADILLRIAND